MTANFELKKKNNKSCPYLRLLFLLLSIAIIAIVIASLVIDTIAIANIARCHGQQAGTR